MNCPHCTSSQFANRSRLTTHGYKTFFCRSCRRAFNERTLTPFNRARIQTRVIFKAVLWRLRYKLSLSDLAEMLGVAVEGFYFTKETLRQWETKFAPLITDELKAVRQGKATRHWKVDETLVKVEQKFHYLYRAIDSDGHLVATRLSPVRNSQSTQAFFELALTTAGGVPQQVTTDKEVNYPGAIEKILGKGVEHCTDRYRNNKLEQDRRGIKSRYRSMKGFKTVQGAARFCEAYDEQRIFFKYTRWHHDYRSSGWKRANFKSKYFQLLDRFVKRKMIWRQGVMQFTYNLC